MDYIPVRVNLKQFFSSPYHALFLIFTAFFFVFQTLYIHLTPDSLILFLPLKIFLGSWLQEGIFPLYNPYIFAGIPFAFDIGIGNFHPFNLFFLFPYPWSLALWLALSVYIFLVGFFLFFSQFAHTRLISLLVTFLLFFSGSALIGSDNLTIFTVVSHFGLFFFSLRYLEAKPSPLWLIPLAAGIFMTLAGHIQFVLYGYLMGLGVALWIYKIPIWKILIFFVGLGISVSWYFLLALPIVLESTRLTDNPDYLRYGSVTIPNLVQLFLPFIFGYDNNGASWNVGPHRKLALSIFASLFVLFSVVGKRRITPLFFATSAVLFLTMGFIPIPFFRMPSHMLVIFHFLVILYILQNQDVLFDLLTFVNKHKRLFAISVIGIVSVAFMAQSQMFSSFFTWAYTIVKQTEPNLFFDVPTQRAVGQLFGISLLVVAVWILGITIASLMKKYEHSLFCICVLVVIEGIIFTSHYLYFIPSSVVNARLQLPEKIDTHEYRTQSVSEIIPYFGLTSYIGQVYFQPPFSKEPSLITPQEESTYKELRRIMGYIPSSWSSVYRIKSVQGYNTFVPKDIAEFFNAPSPDYREVYKDLYARNPLIGEQEIGLNVNWIEPSRLTLYDKRWEELGVRYFLSDRPMTQYELIWQEQEKMVYQNEATQPIYSLITNGRRNPLIPVAENPNMVEFSIKEPHVGGEVVMIQRTGGFVAKLNGKEVKNQTDNFTLRVPVEESGSLVVSYSPVRHLKQTLQALVNTQ